MLGVKANTVGMMRMLMVMSDASGDGSDVMDACGSPERVYRRAETRKAASLRL